MADHKCQYRSDDCGWSAYWADWRFPLLHLSGTVVITSSLLALVDDRTFPIQKGEFSTKDGHGNAVSFLTQSNLTSLISLALVYHRVVAGSWLTLAGWRMAFTVLEKDGASLGDLGHMINYRFPPFRSRSTSREAYLLPELWVVSLLATPSLFVSPLLTGAVNWIPTQLYQHSNETLRIPQPGPSNTWNEHNLYSNNRLYEVYNAVGLASTANSLDFNLSVPATYKRYFPWFPIMPPNSTVANVTVPIFRMNSFRPIRDRSEIFEDFSLVDGVIANIHNPNQNFSTTNNSFSTGSDPGRLTIAHTKPWQPSKTVGVTRDIFPSDAYTEATYEYPAATVVTERKLVVMAIQFHGNCTPANNSKFGSFEDFYAYETVANGNHLADKGCFVFFDLNYTAGVTTCKNCPVHSDGVTPGGLVTITDTSAQILPDPLVETALAMMPDVMFYTEIANSSFGPTFNNVEGYVRGMLSNAYQASWNSLARSFLNDSFAETTYRRPVPALVAHLSKGRVISWCILNILLTVSACLLHIARRRSNFKAVIKPEMTALFIDTCAVTDADFSGLCNMRKSNKEDQNLHLRLECRDERTEQRAHDRSGGCTADRVEEGDDARKGERPYRHPVLVKEDIDVESADSSLPCKWLKKSKGILGHVLPWS